MKAGAGAEDGKEGSAALRGPSAFHDVVVDWTNGVSAMSSGSCMQLAPGASLNFAVDIDALERISAAHIRKMKVAKRPCHPEFQIA